jgi:Domain of unknown function (DUF5666)
MPGRTTLPVLLMVLAGVPLVPSLAAPPAPPAIVSGTIASVDSDTLEVTTPAGAKEVLMSAGTRVEVWLPARLRDLKVDVFVGVESRRMADGSLKALVIHIFQPEGRGQVPNRQFPWVNGNTMTNAVISASVTRLSGTMLTLPYEGGTATVTVTSDTDIRRAVAGTREDLKVGLHILAFGTPNENGSFTAAGIALDKGR